MRFSLSSSSLVSLSLLVFICFCCGEEICTAREGDGNSPDCTIPLLSSSTRTMIANETREDIGTDNITNNSNNDEQQRPDDGLLLENKIVEEEQEKGVSSASPTPTTTPSTLEEDIMVELDAHLSEACLNIVRKSARDCHFSTRRIFRNCVKNWKDTLNAMWGEMVGGRVFANLPVKQMCRSQVKSLRKSCRSMETANLAKNCAAFTLAVAVASSEEKELEVHHKMTNQARINLQNPSEQNSNNNNQPSEISNNEIPFKFSFGGIYNDTPAGISVIAGKVRDLHCNLNLHMRETPQYAFEISDVLMLIVSQSIHCPQVQALQLSAVLLEDELFITIEDKFIPSPEERLEEPLLLFFLGELIYLGPWPSADDDSFNNNNNNSADGFANSNISNPLQPSNRPYYLQAIRRGGRCRKFAPHVACLSVFDATTRVSDGKGCVVAKYGKRLGFGCLTFPERRRMTVLPGNFNAISIWKMMELSTREIFRVETSHEMYSRNVYTTGDLVRIDQSSFAFHSLSGHSRKIVEFLTALSQCTLPQAILARDFPGIHVEDAAAEMEEVPIATYAYSCVENYAGEKPIFEKFIASADVKTRAIVVGLLQRRIVSAPNKIFHRLVSNLLTLISTCNTSWRRKFMDREKIENFETLFASYRIKEEEKAKKRKLMEEEEEERKRQASLAMKGDVQHHDGIQLSEEELMMMELAKAMEGGVSDSTGNETIATPTPANVSSSSFSRFKSTTPALSRFKILDRDIFFDELAAVPSWCLLPEEVRPSMRKCTLVESICALESFVYSHSSKEWIDTPPNWSFEECKNRTSQAAEDGNENNSIFDPCYNADQNESTSCSLQTPTTLRQNPFLFGSILSSFAAWIGLRKHAEIFSDHHRIKLWFEDDLPKMMNNNNHNDVISLGTYYSPEFEREKAFVVQPKNVSIDSMEPIQVHQSKLSFVTSMMHSNLNRSQIEISAAPLLGFYVEDSLALVRQMEFETWGGDEKTQEEGKENNNESSGENDGESSSENSNNEKNQTATESPRIAICVTGAMRGADKAFSKNVEFFRSLLPADFFVLSVDDEMSIKSLLFQPVSVAFPSDPPLSHDSLPPQFYLNTEECTERYLQQMYGIYACGQLISSFERTSGVHYSLKMRIRPDSVFNFKIDKLFDYKDDIYTVARWRDQIFAADEHYVNDHFAIGSSSAMNFIFNTVWKECVEGREIQTPFRDQWGRWLSETMIMTCAVEKNVTLLERRDWALEVMRAGGSCGTSGCW